MGYYDDEYDEEEAVSPGAARGAPSSGEFATMREPMAEGDLRRIFMGEARGLNPRFFDQPPPTEPGRAGAGADAMAGVRGGPSGLTKESDGSYSTQPTESPESDNLPSPPRGQVRLPRILEGGVESNRPPIPESAFRPFEPGGDTGTLDAPYQSFEQSNRVRAAHFERESIRQQGEALAIPPGAQPYRYEAGMAAFMKSLDPNAELTERERQDAERFQLNVQARNAGQPEPFPDHDHELNEMTERAETLALGPAEQLRLQELQNQSAQVAQAVTRGSLSPYEGQVASAQLDRQSQPLMVRASQARAIMQQLQYRRAQQQMAHQTALLHQSQRPHYLDVGNGQRVPYVVDARGNVHWPPAASLPQQAERQQQQQRLQQERAEATRTASAERAASSAVYREFGSFMTRGAAPGLTTSQRAALRPPWLPAPPENETNEQSTQRIQRAIDAEIQRRLHRTEQAVIDPAQQQAARDAINQLRFRIPGSVRQ